MCEMTVLMIFILTWVLMFISYLFFDVQSNHFMKYFSAVLIFATGFLVASFSNFVKRRKNERR